METGENKQEVTSSHAERILAIIKVANLTDEELGGLANEIAKLVEARKEAVAADAHKTVTQETAEAVPQAEKEEERNRWGLPHSWARQTSLKGLEIVRESLQRAGSANSRVISAALKDFLINQAGPEYRQYCGATAILSTNVNIPSEKPEELAHLALSSEERLAYLQERYPKGMKVMDSKSSGKYHIRWDKIADFESWAISNHSQTLATLNRRGGLAPHEAASIIFSVSITPREYPEESLMKFFQENGYFTDESKA